LRPLDRFNSIKVKLGLVIVVAVGVTLFTVVIGHELGLQLRWRLLAAIVLSLGSVQLIARGLTAPLREMAAAADAMAGGEHGRQVAVPSRDEVGRLAEAFNAMSAELAQVDRVRRDMVANVSHELRTPLSALQASLENIVDGVQPADEATLAAMQAQVARLTRLVEQLLDLSRMESEGIALDVRPFAVGALVERVCVESRLVAPDDVGLCVDVSPSALEISGDEERIHQVVMNLVENAVRFSPRPGTVTIRARPAGASVRLEVADEGPGIPAVERTRAFERFHRVDAARPEGGGAGLGLAIARWIVDLHGGTIHAEDAEPRGCRMVVDLPAAA
jgi:signal transduction histidine kinase